MLVAAMVLALVPIVRAQTMPGDRRNDAIRINGHWMIDVLDADGTLAERREFDNALTPTGGGILSRILTQTNGLARWTIELGAFNGGPCSGGTFNGINTNSCYMVDAQATPVLAGTAVFRTLTAAIGGPNNVQLILTGTVTAATAGEIDFVSTVQSLCANTVAGCNLPAINDRFTGHTLDTPVLVTAGQIIQVTVTISFCNTTGCLS
ncbi:MAG: hypothetical protein ACRD2I_00470 [Vicinamibacterales bacterium]